jgi:hypothetical protein
MTPGHLLLLPFLAAGPAAADEAIAAFAGDWRLAHAIAAPWVEQARVDPALLGRSVHIAAGRLDGPGVLACGTARVEAIESPAEGLFQGMLPAPADAAAAQLGLGAWPVPGLRVHCSTGVFDFHRADEHALLLALDNVVWTLDRAPGTQAPAGTPEAQVQALLEGHFGGDMGFTREGVAARQPLLAAPLRARIAAYLAAPRPDDEPPAIDGDPFTDSQEYPTRFAVLQGRIEDGRARVPVRFADAHRQRQVDYELVREADGVWRVAELHYEGSETFSDLLAPP